jgi:hypothetical protein
MYKKDITCKSCFWCEKGVNPKSYYCLWDYGRDMTLVEVISNYRCHHHSRIDPVYDNSPEFLNSHSRPLKIE